MPSHGRPQLRIEDFRDLRSIDSARFKVAQDFSVEIAPRIGGAGTALRLVDASLGIAIDSPYFEEDQCWRLLIWQLNEVVYIASGNEDEEALYDTFLSLPVEKYRKAWAELLSSLKSCN